MRRHLGIMELDGGSRLRLDCGHRARPMGQTDGTADCALCSVSGGRRRLDAGEATL